MKYRVLQQGMFKEVSLPCFGKQDVGISPGGAMDSFALISGNRLLGNPDDASALEMLYPPRIQFEEDCLFILTGAAVKDAILTEKDIKKSICHAVVYRAEKGFEISFGLRQYGFRTYLCSIPMEKAAPQTEGHDRGLFQDCCSWTDPDDCIRLIEGPEYRYFPKAEEICNDSWIISNDISDMGMRLVNDRISFKSTMKGNMISEAVSNGTIQMTPKGPIILLKHRQTVGGYPRMFNVISADVDMLGQYGPGQLVRFKKITLSEAREISIKKVKDLNKLRSKV
jgi:5-oxoprolinase (ATP-hydrolysing) subunit C